VGTIKQSPDMQRGAENRPLQDEPLLSKTNKFIFIVHSHI